MGAILNRKNVPVAAICLQCGYPFQKTTAINDFCSPKCKQERRNQLRGPHVSVKKEKPIKPVKEKPNKQVVHIECLNRKQKKNEKDAALNMIELNRNAPAHDREILKKKKIASPKLSEMEYRIHDKRMKITYYFKTKEKYDNYLINNPS